jgi:osmotically-inducible protein OsmY
VEINASGEKVKLWGKVPRAALKKAVEETAGAVSGVRSVENRLEVAFPPGAVIPTEEEIKASVLAELDLNSVERGELKIRTEAGKVILEGSVLELQKKKKIEEIVSEIEGVMVVENHITVVPTEEIVDAVLARDIERNLMNQSGVDSERITVKVKKGNAVLKGKVSDAKAYRKAYEAAMNTAGIRDLENRMEIRGEENE